LSIVSAALTTARLRYLLTAQRFRSSAQISLFNRRLIAQRDRPMVAPTSDSPTAQRDRPIAQISKYRVTIPSTLAWMTSRIIIGRWLRRLQKRFVSLRRRHSRYTVCHIMDSKPWNNKKPFNESQ